MKVEISRSNDAFETFLASFWETLPTCPECQLGLPNNPTPEGFKDELKPTNQLLVYIVYYARPTNMQLTTNWI